VWKCGGLAAPHCGGGAASVHRPPWPVALARVSAGGTQYRESEYGHHGDGRYPPGLGAAGGDRSSEAEGKNSHPREQRVITDDELIEKPP
jgi:hypothetical protein